MSEPNLSKDPRPDAGASGPPSDPTGGTFSPYRAGPASWVDQPEPQGVTYEASRSGTSTYDSPSGAASYPGFAGGSRTNGMAVASLVASIGGWTLVPGIGWIVGIILGHMARSQMRTSGEQGAGLALAGLVIGYVSIILAVGVVFVLGYLVLELFSFS